MNIKPAIRQKLLQNTAITALVGQRIYPSRMPQDMQFPSIVVTVISGNSENHMQNADRLIYSTVQLDILSLSEDQAYQIAEYVRNSLDGFSGTIAAIQVGYCWLTRLQDDWTAPQNASDVGISRVSLDFNTCYFVAEPTHP